MALRVKDGERHDRFELSKSFPTKDGYVFVSSYLLASEKQWKNLTELIGKTEWGAK